MYQVRLTSADNIEATSTTHPTRVISLKGIYNYLMLQQLLDTELGCNNWRWKTSSDGDVFI